MYYWMLLVPAILWGTLGVFVGWVAMTATQIAAIRTVLAGLFLGIFFLFRKKKLEKGVFKKYWKRLFLTGVLIGANWIGLFAAYSISSVSVATVLYYLAPAIVIGLSPFVFKERLTAPKLVGLVAALGGMACVSFSAGVGQVSIWGILLAVFAACCYAGVTMLNKPIRGMGGLEITMFEMFFAMAVVVPYAIFIAPEPWVMPDTRGILSLLFIGIVLTGVCYAFYFTAVQHLKAQTTAICSFADPLASLLIAALVLGDRLTLLQWIGAVLILGGAMVAELWPTSRRI